MNSRQKKELQENLDFVRQNLGAGEPELPLSLSGAVLRQKAAVTAKTTTYQPWKKMLPLACAFVLVAGIGLSSMGGMKAASTDDTAEQKIALAEATAFALEDTVAENPQASSLAAVEVTTQFITHTAAEDSRELFLELYPEMTDVDIFTLVEGGRTYLVVRNDYGDSVRSIAILGNEMEDVPGENLTIRDVESGKELVFDAYSLQPIQ